METQTLEQTNEPQVGANSPTKDDLLRRAKNAIDAGEQFQCDAEQSFRDAAEALADAQELHCVFQAEMARAVGKSEAWVSYLLQWRRSGYKGSSPFGPTTKAGRLQHAEDRAATGVSKPRKRKVNTQHVADATDAKARVDDRQIADAGQEPEPQAEDCSAPQSSSPRNPSPEEAKGNLRYAIDQWWKYMDDAGKAEITTYFMKRRG